ncbi:tyrosine-type recombinase/integrase [Patescibacteria group bacterium]|nr:tyrosine-type recombinase/integrase [Patescibacteria group bacterium]
MNNPVKLREAHNKFHEFLKSNKRASATIELSGNAKDQLISFLEELKREHITEVTSVDIQAFLTTLQGKGYTAKSLSRKLNSTRTFYRFLKVSEYITDDPSLMVQHPKYELNPPRILTPLEYRALRDAASVDPRIYAIIEVLLQTGIRIGELYNLRVDDIRENSLYIRPQEGHDAREVPLNRRAKEALRKYLEIRPKTDLDYVFVTKTGKSFLVRNIRDSVERYFKKAGIENAKINDLRHTFVAHHLKHGVSIVVLSKILGHKRLSSTERYLEYVKEKEGNGTTLVEL